MQTLLWVALGSGIGGAGRYLLVTYAEKLTTGEFPWGTLLVNVIGSLIIGYYVAAMISSGRLLGAISSTIFLANSPKVLRLIPSLFSGRLSITSI